MSRLTKWHSCRLGLAPVTFVDGDRSAKYPKRAEFVAKGIPFLNAESISNGRLDASKANHIPEEKFAEITKGRLLCGDLILTTRGNGVGKPAFYSSTLPALINAQLLIIRPDQEHLHPGFLYYSFCNPPFQSQLQNFRSGSAQPQLPITALRELEFTFPPLSAQRKIASVLSTYDDLIENNTHRIAILETMAQTIYREWFVEFRFPGHKKVKLVDSTLGKIPDGWEAKCLSECCDLVMGQSPSSTLYNETGEGLPFHQGVTNFGDRYPTHSVFTTALNRLAESGDVLFSVRAPVGRLNIADTKIVVGRGVSAIRRKDGNQIFLFHQLKEQFKDEDMMGGGTIFKSVTKEDMQKIGFICPPPSILAAFEDAVGAGFQSYHNLTKRNRLLRKTRDLLLPKLISSQLDVEDLDIENGEAVTD